MQLAGSLGDVSIDSIPSGLKAIDVSIYTITSFISHTPELPLIPFVSLALDSFRRPIRADLGLGGGLLVCV